MKLDNPKLRNLEYSVIQRQKLRAAGRRVVLTNGVFDLLHTGHLYYLQQARQLGTALHVALAMHDHSQHMLSRLADQLQHVSLPVAAWLIHGPGPASASPAAFQLAYETLSRVTPLDDDGRVDEIARMLGGVKITDTTRQHAREMLDAEA